MKTRRSFLNRLGVIGTSLFLPLSAKAAPAKDLLIHQVYFWLKDPEKDMKSFLKGCEDLIKIDSIKKAYIGKPAATARREAVDHSFHVSLTVHFRTMEDHNIYQIHETHKKFIAKHEEKWKKVQVYDTKIE
ncbi:Dabb family protein [Echinicola vietnamensis]|uniref:Stress responsive A/B Barrel Domain-containing protein n=1 Tax=Echinicola vietnamensis (strain DSM 17526 / LMG 23754 / KMM 6221) TaxID=926556 RepID=L0G5I4_ECHVK|nr:Dabb family protein [Echinicola vietnamensis]AGA80095.1 Stress responsive A/B Barrel Domain-containing protein [Echinicola vietnamensis DSM 17526]